MKRFYGLIFSVLAFALLTVSCSKDEGRQEEEIGDCLYFTAQLPDSRISMKASGNMTILPKIEYCLDGRTWNDCIFGETVITLDRDESVYFRGDNAVLSYPVNEDICYVYFAMDGMFDANGNVMSLLDKSCNKKIIPGEYCFACLFKDCKGLTGAPSLPATTLSKGCYNGMFFGCVNLEFAPELPATVLKEGCYSEMFQNCASLEKAPALPATTLASGCYFRMFSKCMNLKDMNVSFNVWNPQEATFEWVDGVNEDGVFHCPGDLAKTFDKSHIPVNFIIRAN